MRRPPLLSSASPLLLLALLLALLLTSSGCGQEALQLVGTVERTTLELAAPVSEVIVEVPVSRGDRVAAGAVVVRLDSAVAQAELRAYEAAHDAARATLTEAEGDYQRTEELRRARVATPQKLDAARRARDEARALVAEKEARIAQATKRLEDLTIRTHLPGVVDQLPYEPGERVPAGGVVAVVLADEKPWVRVWLPARAVAHTTLDSRAQIEIEGFDHALSGRVVEIARESEFTPHYALTEEESAHLVYETRIVLDDAPEALRPGLPARVILPLPEQSAGGSAEAPDAGSGAVP